MTSRVVPLFPISQCGPSQGFDAFYAAYPRKAGKADGQKAYIQAMLAGHTPEAILTGAKCYAEYHRKLGTEPRYMLLPASFLRGERFLDEEILEHLPPSPEAIAEAQDKADRLMKRGKYREY